MSHELRIILVLKKSNYSSHSIIPTRPFTFLRLLFVVELTFDVGGGGLQSLQRLQRHPGDGQLAVDILLGEIGEDCLQVSDVLPELEHLGLRQRRKQMAMDYCLQCCDMMKSIVIM